MGSKAWLVSSLLTLKQLGFFLNVISFSHVVHYECIVLIWNWSSTMNIFSAPRILMAWCCATVLSMHPYVSRFSLGVKVMARRRTGDKPFSWSMIAYITDTGWIRHHWIKNCVINQSICNAICSLFQHNHAQKSPFEWGILYQKRVSWAGTSNYAPQILWDVITCPCPWYLLLAHTSSNQHEAQGMAPVPSRLRADY